MGSFCTTCFLSGLPIRHRDDVVVLVLIARDPMRRSQRGHGFSNPNDEFEPLFVPIHGKYDDCGGLEKTKKQVADQLIPWFENLLDPSADSPRFTPGEEKPAFSSLGGLLRCLQKDLVRGRAYMGEGLQVAYAMAHAGIYSKMLASMGARIPYQRDVSFRDCLMADLVTSIEFLRSTSEELPEDIDLNDPEQLKAWSGNCRAIDATLERCLEGISSPYNRSLLRTLAGSTLPVADVAGLMADFILLRGVADALHVLFHPTVTSGVEYEYALRLELLDASREQIGKVKAMLDEECDGDVSHWGAETVFYHQH